MRISWLIRLHSDADEVSWATFDSAGHLVESATHVPVETLPHQNCPPLVLIPSTEITLASANIPSKQWKRIVQAVPYALEDQLAEDVENLHFAVGKRESGKGDIAVAVIAHRQMQTHLQRLSAVGIAPVVLIPDVLAVPKPADGWGVSCFDDVVLVRTGLQAGFAIEPNCFGTALHKALIEHEEAPPQQIVVFSGIRPVTILTDLHALGILVTEKTHKQGTLAWLAQGAAEKKPLNLLQNAYRPQDKVATLWQPWRLTAVLLMLWGGLLMAKQWEEYRQLNQQRQRLNTQIEKTYRDTFPKARKIVNPRVQMEQKLAALRAKKNHTKKTDNFLSILNRISTPLTRTPGFHLKRIDFRQGRFDIQMTVANLQALEYLKQRLSQLGLTVKIQSASSRNGQIESRLQIDTQHKNTKQGSVHSKEQAVLSLLE